MFSSKAIEFNLRRPRIHLLINNRTTHLTTINQNERVTRAAKSYHAMGEENLHVLFKAYQEHQDYFSHDDEMPDIENIDAFQKKYFEDVRDFHTTAILCLHTGCPLGALSGKIEFADGTSVKVDQKKKKE